MPATDTRNTSRRATKHRTLAEQNADIIRMAQRLEKRLAERGGLGRGLGEYARSLSGELPSEVVHDIMRVNRVRNDLVHRNIDMPLSHHERAKIAQSYQRAYDYLGKGDLNAPRSGPRISPWVLGLTLLALAGVVWVFVAG